MNEWKIVVVSGDLSARRALADAFEHLEIDPIWLSTIDECRRLPRRDTIDLVFCSESVDDGDYWGVYGAMTRGLLKGPKIILIASSLSQTECHLAELCGIFAVIERSCQVKCVEWTIAIAGLHLGKRQRRDTTALKLDIFSGTPDDAPVWICAVDGLSNAREKMERLAKDTPGRYFIFHAPEQTVLVSIETFSEGRGRQSA